PADVGGVPCRPFRPEDGDDEVSCGVAVDPSRARFCERNGPGRVAVAEVTELAVPARHEVLAVRRDDLVGAGFGPRAPVPHLAQPGPWLLATVGAPPGGLVAIHVPPDLRGAGAERPDVRDQLAD